MKTSEITNSINTLPKIGPAKAALFAKLNIFTIADLLQYYPRDYEDRTQKITLHECLQAIATNGQAKAHTIVQVLKHDWFGYGAMKTLKIIVTDGTASAEIVAFNRPWLQNSMKIGSIFALTGVFNNKYGNLQTSQYDTEKIADTGKLKDFINMPIPNSKVFPIYRQTEGLTSKQINAAIETALKQYAKVIENDLPDSLIEKKGLLPKNEALQKIHLPKSIQEAAEARQTLVYEELFLFQRAMAQRSIDHKGFVPKVNAATGEIEAEVQKSFTTEEFESTLSPRQKQLLSRLPFQPTDDQKSVIAQMNIDIDRNYESARDKSGKNFSMRTLLQGDVGSGKTLVSFFAALRVIDYGSQCALMAPTELLAR
ncbi:MAG: ATP-dependent DNA helicase RecG, partial [Treponema sp.]|nr:ATP-dependent DNA helicase RecG [Treponema sp.]